MFVQYIATRPILDLCKKTVQRPGAWVASRWWEKEGLDLEGARATAKVAADGEEGVEGVEEER